MFIASDFKKTLDMVTIKEKNLPFDIHTNIYSLYVLFNCAKDLLYD